MSDNVENQDEGLSLKQEAYCQAYMVCGNQSAAYRIAYDAEASNSNTVAVEACRIHSNPKVALRIKQLRQEAWERNKIHIDELIQSLAGMVRFDIADLYDEDGRMRPLHQIPIEARQMISQLDTDELFTTIDGQREVIGHTKKVRTINKLDAVEKLMRYFGAYEKDNEQSKARPMVILDLGKGKAEE